MFAEEPIRDGPIYERSQKELLKAFDVRERVEDSLVCTFPDERVGDDDGGRKRRRAPVGSEVDDRGGKPSSEEDVAGQVAVNELALNIKGSQQSDEPWQVLDVREVFGR